MAEKKKEKIGNIDTLQFDLSEFYLDVALRNFFRLIHICGAGTTIDHKGIDEDYLDGLSHGKLKNELEAFEWCAFFTLPFLLMGFIALFWCAMYLVQYRTELDFTIAHYIGLGFIIVLYSSILMVTFFCLGFLAWMKFVHPYCLRKAHDRYITLRNEKMRVEGERRRLEDEKRNKSRNHDYNNNDDNDDFDMEYSEDDDDDDDMNGSGFNDKMTKRRRKDE